MKKFTANLVLVLLSILIGFSVHSSVYAADDAKVEIWSYSLNERIEHRLERVIPISELCLRHQI